MIYGSDNLEKRCKICGKIFETQKLGNKRKYCYECSPHYSHEDKKGRAKTITALRRALKLQLVKYKGGKCERCGYNKSINALQFHHINPSQKKFNISQYACSNNLDIDKLYQEVDKCILLCSNCHAEEHEKNGFFM